MNTPDKTKDTGAFTQLALEQIEKAEQTIALLRADLNGLNVALTTGGNETVAERLAHDALLAILYKLVPASDAIVNLSRAMQNK